MSTTIQITRRFAATYVVFAVLVIALLVASCINSHWWHLYYGSNNVLYNATISLGLWKSCMEELSYSRLCSNYIKDSDPYESQITDVEFIRVILIFSMSCLSLAILFMLQLVCKRSRKFLLITTGAVEALTWLTFLSLCLCIGFSTFDKASIRKPRWMVLSTNAVETYKDYGWGFIVTCVATILVVCLIIIITGHLIMLSKHDKSAQSNNKMSYMSNKQILYNDLTPQDYLKERYKNGVYQTDVNGNINILNEGSREEEIKRKKSGQQGDYYSSNYSEIHFTDPYQQVQLTTRNSSNATSYDYDNPEEIVIETRGTNNEIMAYDNPLVHVPSCQSKETVADYCEECGTTTHQFQGEPLPQFGLKRTITLPPVRNEHMNQIYPIQDIRSTSLPATQGAFTLVAKNHGFPVEDYE